MWTCDGGVIGIAPTLEAPYFETRLGFVTVVVVGWWCCLCVAAEEVHTVRVGEEMQRDHGCWLSWAGVHGGGGDSGDGVPEVLLFLWL